MYFLYVSYIAIKRYLFNSTIITYLKPLDCGGGGLGNFHLDYLHMHTHTLSPGSELLCTLKDASYRSAFI